MVNKQATGRPFISEDLKRKPRSIKVRDSVYNKLHDLGCGSYAKGIEFLVYTYTEILDPEDDYEDLLEDESCTTESNGKTRCINNST